MGSMTLATRAGLAGLVGYVLIAVLAHDLSRHDPPYVPYLTVLVHLPVALATLALVLAARKRRQEARPVVKVVWLVVACSYVALAALLLAAAPVVFWDFIT